MRWSMAFVFVAVATPAFAQDRLPRQVYACATIAEDGPRHACFDALVPELKLEGAKSEAAPPAQPTPQQQAARLGLPSARPSPLTAPVAAPGAPKPAEPDVVQLAVTSISIGADGKARIAMENGQVWRQVDVGRLKNIGEGPPWIAQIRKAALGSFLLKVGNSPVVHVERVN